MISDRLLRLFLFAFLAMPFFGLFFRLNSFPTWPAEASHVIAITLLQSFLSAMFSLIFGLVSALGLCSIRDTRWQHRLSIFILAPNFLPSVFFVLSFLTLSTQFHFSAQGWIALVVAHVGLNTGLVSINLAEVIRRKASAMMELSWVEGAKAWVVIFKVLIPYLKKDLFLQFILVFALSMTSFSIPLILSSGQAVTLELLIYQKILISGEISQAVMLSFLQILILLILSLFFLKGRSLSGAKVIHLEVFSFHEFLVIPLGISFFIFLGFAASIEAFLRQSQFLNLYLEELFSSWFATVAVATATGVICFFLSCIVFWILPKRWEQKLFLAYVSPSAILTGFALLLFGPTTGTLVYFKMIFGISLLLFPILYRSGVQSLIDGLEEQWSVARTLGAKSNQIFREISWPQIIKPLSRLSGLAAFWAAGDYGLSSIVAPRPVTLGLQVRALLSSYRLDAAGFVVTVILITGTLLYLTFGGLGNVLSRKFNS
jgi:thiamine transport system permease protein